MHNIGTFHSADFGKFLLDSSFVVAGKEKFFVHWVRKFFEMRTRWPDMLWHEHLPLYLKELLSSGYEDWQIRQADQSVRMYFCNFAKTSESECRPRTLSNDKKAGKNDILRMFSEALRLRNYARRTESTYIGWAERYIRYCKDESSSREVDSFKNPERVKDFLTYLAVKKQISASTQNQAFNSLIMFFRLVLNTELGDLKNTVRARTKRKLPTVFAIEEIEALFSFLSGTIGLMLKLIYGGGLRVNECCRLRIKDIDFDQNLIFVRYGKGGKDRTTLLPESLKNEIRAHIARVYSLHNQDLAEGFGSVWLPDALKHKYPRAAKEKAWQYLFPSMNRSIDPESGTIRRHHASDSSLQRALKTALKKAGIHKHASVHTLRHSFATHLLLAGIDIRQIQVYMGHAKVETTMIYTHVIKDMRNPVASPFDTLNLQNSTGKSHTK